MKDETFLYFGGSWKNLSFREGVYEKPKYKEGLPKNGGGAWTVFRFNVRGLGKKEGGGVFEVGGWYQMYTMNKWILRSLEYFFV